MVNLHFKIRNLSRLLKQSVSVRYVIPSKRIPINRYTRLERKMYVLNVLKLDKIKLQYCTYNVKKFTEPFNVKFLRVFLRVKLVYIFNDFYSLSTW